MENTFFTASFSETEKIGEDFAGKLDVSGDDNVFVAFEGDLGAGKTAFIRGMGRVICPRAEVCSPTYAIINEYKSAGKTLMCHIDAYRIKDDDDLYSTGFYDCIEYPGCVTCVEWSENIPFAVPADAYKVRIEKISENERKITVTEP